MIARCQICGGPIGSGEPVVVWEEGFAHRFRPTCDWHKDEVARREMESWPGWMKEGRKHDSKPIREGGESV